MLLVAGCSKKPEESSGTAPVGTTAGTTEAAKGSAMPESAGLGIGMLVGAGAGLAGGAFTGNKDVVLPAETMLSFKLFKPVEIKM